MHFKRITTISLLVLTAACGQEEYTTTIPAPRIDSIELSEVSVTLPEADGKELIEQHCMPCHSLRYIEMQPDFPRKTWDKIVTKMIKVYGAPVKDSFTAAKIVDYLARIKGA